MAPTPRHRTVARGFVGSVLRHTPVRGRGAVARWLRRHPGPEITYRDRSGWWRTADLRIDLEAYWFVGIGGLPASVVASVPAGSWAIDAGANTGIMTGQLSRAVGRDGVVWAVEPLPLNLRRLHDLRGRNDLPQLTVIECALGGSDGRAMLRTAGPTGGAAASFTASWIDQGEVEVTTRTLDGLVAERPVDRPLALVKIDVEGAEFAVIDGARGTIERYAPPIFCEFNDPVLRDMGRSSAELLERFGDLGYRPAPEYEAASGLLTDTVVDLLLRRQ